MGKLASWGVGVGSFIFGETIGMGLVLSVGVILPFASIIIGGLTGLASGYFGAKLINKINKKENKKELTFYSYSLYFKYVPKKYREYAIPTLKLKDAPLKSKSIAIELIINGDGKNPNWVIINIPAKSGEIEINKYLDEGETIIKYKGIPENAFSALFSLYIFDIKNINYNKFISMKEGLEEGKQLKQNLIDFKMLVASKLIIIYNNY